MLYLFSLNLLEPFQFQRSVAHNIHLTDFFGFIFFFQFYFWVHWHTKCHISRICKLNINFCLCMDFEFSLGWQKLGVHTYIYVWRILNSSAIINYKILMCQPHNCHAIVLMEKYTEYNGIKWHICRSIHFYNAKISKSNGAIQWQCHATKTGVKHFSLRSE